MLGPSDPGPLPTYPTVKSEVLDSTQREGGALNKPIHFPSLSRSGGGSADHNHVVVKKK